MIRKFPALTQVNPSNQVQSTLPDFVSESYKEFVKFMSFADQSEERIGFSQDLLQNLERYRDFDTYKRKIVEYGVLAENIAADADELTLESGVGFPEADGILYINDEIILYRQKTGNIFSGLQRGASGTVILPTFTTKGTYVDSVASNHLVGSPVQNLSVLFLVSFLETIYKSYAPDINSSRVSPEVDSMTFLENIRDFFQAKGSKLGIKALFKLLFADNDVDVNYPGDRMIIPSDSTWFESLIMRTVPIPPNLVNPTAKYTLPNKIQNSSVFLRSYNSEEIIASSTCEYVSSYPFEGDVQYELYLNKDQNAGDFIANPVTKLTRAAKQTGQQTTNVTDIKTITVESTLGFPNSGVMFIGNEGIEYTSKSLNQFFGCKRGHIGIEAAHDIGSSVYGPFYIEAKTNIDDIEFTSFSWPLGLVNSVDVVDGGLLHLENDDVYINGPGRIDPRSPALASFIENYTDQLTLQGQLPPELTFVQNYTASVNGVYFDAEYIFVSSSGFPYYPIGPFSDNGTVGDNLTVNETIFVIPRLLRENNDIVTKGTDQIGVAVDGVPIYSEVSNVDLVQGEIKTFNIKNRGSGYQNPTIIIDPANSEAEARVVNGQITAVLQKTTGNYLTQPTVKVTSGEGASFNLTFDNFGRITGVTVDTAGRYYLDVPALTVVDSSGRGQGALISCTVDGGSIFSVNVENTGIDYNPLTTSIFTTPIGSGAVIEAVVESYQFNRYQTVVANPNWTFDSGNGFLWNSPLAESSTFGYICDPTYLRSSLEDNGAQHSPIIGWAFDGNPIYGPYGYTNGKNISGGIERQKSGYILRDDRAGLGSASPTIAEYKMGSFVEDYVWEAPSVSRFDITTELGIELETNDGSTDPNEIGKTLVADSQQIARNVLNENNGRICNTPEFPEENYPDGVFAYFVTIDDNGLPAFPYMIGTTFNNRPISQQLNVTSDLSDSNSLRSAEYSPSSYDDTQLTFDFTRVERYRNPFLSESKRDVDLKIADVTAGGLSSVIVESGLPDTTKVGDILYYDNSDTGGTGAEGRVEFVKGQPIQRAEGELVFTYLRSHHQRLPLDAYQGKESFVFVPDTFILCTSGAIAQVIEWDADSYQLEVQTKTWGRVEYEDIFYDNRGKLVMLPPKPDEAYYGLANTHVSLGATRPNQVLMSPHAPSLAIGGADPEPGDMWWSIFNGRLYVYYDDGQTEQWVEAQPMGTQPIENTASNVGVGTTAATLPDLVNAGTDNTVTISTMAPSERSDGTANVLGDLWWSNQTGMLYIWYTDILVGYAADRSVDAPGLGQWVMTDPTGTVPTVGALDMIYPDLSTPSTNRGNIFSNSITVIISDTAPTNQIDGTLVEPGNLWWCTLNGKMYIYWNDGDTFQWTQTTPIGSVSTPFASDDPLHPEPGPDPDIPDPDAGNDIGVLPEKRDTKLLWFRSMRHFLPEDITNFQLGAPGSAPLTEIAKLESVGTPDNANGIFIRGYNDDALILPNRSLMTNDTRALYRVVTDGPTDLNIGDKVKIENSSFDEVNDVHTVVGVGYVVPGQVGVTINEITSEVDSLTIQDPGAYYTKNFYIFFTGGGGQGAYGFATVKPLVQGGGIDSVTLLNGGVNYNSVPTPVLGTEMNNNVFEIYVNNIYGVDNPSVKYSASGENVMNVATQVKLNSGGIGYTKIPPALGLYKNEADRADLRINDGSVAIDGSGIERVTVIGGGARYVSPTAVFGDRTNNGSGAAADVIVENGVVTAVNVTSSGSGYVEPFVVLVEESGKFISTTRDIGKITAGTVINPGRNISVDRSLKPELQITTRCIIRYINDLRGPFVPGTQVYQGTEEMKQVTATVLAYDDKIQQLTLEKVDGVLKANEIIQDDYGTTAMVLLSGEADCRAIVSGTSEPEGTFITDKSQVSEKFAVIQDSKKYQWFSYEIESGIQRVDYENFINDIIHPSGFIMLSALGINDSVSTTLDVSEPELSGTGSGEDPSPPPPPPALELTVSISPRDPVFTGDTITCTAVTTGGTAPYTTTYQWQQDLGVITSWTDFPGATESTFTIPLNRIGWAFRCQVVTTDQNGNTLTETSLPTFPASERQTSSPSY